jgi:nicotinamidase-related amidase
MGTTDINLSETSGEFLSYLDEWYKGLPPLSLEELVGGQPEKVAVFCVDMINGFAYEGPLASQRVASLAQPIVELFSRAYELGVRHFILPQDSHSHDAEEFKTFPPHAREGTSEAETIQELKDLPFADSFVIIKKNSTNPAIGTGLGAWMDAHPEVETGIVVGDCSDLCTYQMTLHLRLSANAHDLRGRRVVVPASCVDTFELGLHVARQIGGRPHPGDFHHVMFLNHMAQNGVEVVRELT